MLKDKRYLYLIAGLSLPLVLGNNNNYVCSDAGPLRFIRGSDAYIDMHGNSWDYNNTLIWDYVIIGLISGILLWLFCKPKPKSGFLKYLLSIAVVLAILFALDIFTLMFGFMHCWEF